MKSKDLLRMAEEEPEVFAELRAKERIRGLDDRQVVELYFREGLDCALTDRQQKIHDRWVAVRRLFLGKMASYTKICKELVEVHGVSVTTARRDIADMTRIFGAVDAVAKDAHRLRAIEMSLKAYRVAEKAKDADAMTRAAKAYREAAGLDTDTDAPDMQRLMNERVFPLALDEGVRTMLLAALMQSGGTLDVAALMGKVQALNPNIQDVEYETIPEPDGAHQSRN